MGMPPLRNTKSCSTSSSRILATRPHNSTLVFVLWKIPSRPVPHVCASNCNNSSERRQRHCTAVSVALGSGEWPPFATYLSASQRSFFFQGRCISVLATFSVRLISSWPCGLIPLQRFPSHGGRENASSRVSISAAESGWGFVVQGQKTQGCCLSNLFTPLLGFVVIEKGKKILSLVGRQRRQYGPGPLQGIMKRRRGLQDLVR